MTEIVIYWFENVISTFDVSPQNYCSYLNVLYIVYLTDVIKFANNLYYSVDSTALPLVYINIVYIQNEIYF